MSSETDTAVVEDSDDSSLDFKELNDLEYDIPSVAPPSLESVLWEMGSEEGSDNTSQHSFQSFNQKYKSLLFHGILQGVSSQVASAGERAGAGLPTVITNSLKFVAIGTSHGFILAFDSAQKLCWCCHDLTVTDQGAVSSLAFNLDSTRLLVGYERGYISMIDAVNGDVIRRLPDAHAPHSAVLHLRFTSLNSLGLSGDSAGCVFSLTFNRRLTVRTWSSKCLFSGARGEVCVFEPLVHIQDIEILRNTILVAMATLSKVIVISIRPRLKILFTQHLPRMGTTLPLIAWQIVSVGKVMQPVLAWGRNTELNYTRVCAGINTNKLRLTPLRSVHLEYTMCGLYWIGSRHLAILDVSENLRLIEVRTQRELEMLELTSARLVYSSAHFKALALGGCVSEAFALAGERACYNTLSSRGDQLLVLGTKSVQLVKLRTWPERLVYLSDQGRWAEALNLAAEDSAHKENGSTMLLDKFLTSLKQNGIDQDSLTAAVNCCVKLNKVDTLCNDLWEAISSDKYSLEWYYTLLTDHIGNGSLYFLNPSVAQALVAHLEWKNPQFLENVLLSIDLSCLDLHQVLSICKTHNLYEAWIHITTKTMGDYISPLTDFIMELTPNNHRLGNSLLVFVSSCLSGLGYPHGRIPDHDVPRIKHDILRCLETVHSVNAKDDEPTYPYLRGLLKYNTRECLNVADLAFREIEFSGEMGMLQRQRLVQILLSIVTPPEFDDNQIIVLTCFVSRWITSNNLIADEAILNIIIKCITSMNGSCLSLRDNMEREQSWIDLLEADKLQHLTIDELYRLALESKCYRVLENICEKQRNYKSIFQCYLKEKSRHTEVFNYIIQHVDAIERNIKQQFIEHFKELIIIDAKKTSKIVVNNFSDFVLQFCTILESDSNLLFIFLNEIVYTDLKIPPDIAEDYLKLLCIENPSAVYDYAKLNLCRVEKALQITKEYDMHAATALLLELNGDFQESLDLLLNSNMPDEAVQLCIRGSEHLDAAGAQDIWLRLFRDPTTTNTIPMRVVLHAAAPHVPPAQLLELVNDACLGDIKTILQGMLADCQHDKNMLSSTFKILDHDLHRGLAKALWFHNRGIPVRTTVCILCQKSLNTMKDTEQVIVWNCGHCFHEKCISDLTEITNCPRCRIPAIGIPKHTLPIAKCKNIDNSIRLRPDLEGHF